MSKEKKPIHFQDIFKDLLKVFPFLELEQIVARLGDPNTCKDTAEMMDVLERNMELLEIKKDELKEKYSYDEKSVNQFVGNPSNFTEAQWAAIESTKKMIHDYQRSVDEAMETEQIKLVSLEGRQKKKKKKPDRMKRFSKRKKWLEM